MTRTLATAVVVVCASAAHAAPPIRALAVDGELCWAAGDAGTVLRSDDRGVTWRRVAAPALPAANWQAISTSPGGVALFGGTAEPGHPLARGMGAAAFSADGGTTWRALPAPPGWLYGGSLAGQTGVVLGEASGASRGGLWRTTDGGKQWAPTVASSVGFALAGDFHGPRYGWAVGQGRRTVSLRALAEPRIHPPALAGTGSFRAVRFVDDITCWAAGDNAAMFRSASGERPWSPLPSPLPPPGRRLADLEAIAVAARLGEPNAPPRIWVAGGLVGVLARTDNQGGSWTLLKSPGGAIHALAALDADTLLAAGDGGAVWRSCDAGASWKLAAGDAGVDVLFIAAAGDATIYPAAAAHALAGQAVGIVYATLAPAAAGVPGDQPLRAAAAAAGASAVAALSEFPSVAWDANAAALSDRDILQRWSAALDVPAEAEMVRQLAAAIRLYRPSVLAVGPDGAGPCGRRGENRLVARLAQRSAELAAKDDLPDLPALGLRPHAVQRTFVGLETNEKYAPPWQDGPKFDRREAAIVFDGSRFAGGRALPLELLAAEAAWRLPEATSADRPAVITAYAQPGAAPSPAGATAAKLFTSGIAKARLDTTGGTGLAGQLAAGTTLRMAIQRGELTAFAIDLAAALDKAEDANMQALSADRLLLASRRMMEEGNLLDADAAMRAAVRRSRPHGMARRAELIALAAAVSGEWQAQLRRQGVAERLSPETLTRAAGALDRFPAWAGEGEVRLLQARVLSAAGDNVEPPKIFQSMTGDAYAECWRVMALSELGVEAPVGVPLPERLSTIAETTAEAGRLDGVLDEAVWRTAPRIPLQRHPAAGEAAASAEKLPRGEAPAAGDLRRDANAAAGRKLKAAAPVAQVARTAGGFVIFGLALPAMDGRDWTVEIAIDADRDAWTQLLLRCDTLGQRSAELAFRGGPTAKLDARQFPLQARRDGKATTLEWAVPITALAAKADAAAAWAVQIRATALDAAGGIEYYYAPQDDGRLLSERYALVIVPARVFDR